MARTNHTPLAHTLPRAAQPNSNVLRFPVLPEMGMQQERQDRRSKVLELLDGLRELCGNHHSQDDAETTIISEAVYRIASVTRKWILGEIGGAQ